MLYHNYNQQLPQKPVNLSVRSPGSRQRITDVLRLEVVTSHIYLILSDIFQSLLCSHIHQKSRIAKVVMPSFATLNYQCTDQSPTMESLIDRIVIEPRYHVQAVGDNECVLCAVEDMNFLRVWFYEADNKIMMRRCSENVGLCKNDIERNIEVKRAGIPNLWRATAGRLRTSGAPPRGGTPTSGV